MGPYLVSLPSTGMCTHVGTGCSLCPAPTPRDIALGTEGYQARDLVALVHKAIAHSRVESICPLSFVDELRLSPPAKKKKIPAIVNIMSESLQPSEVKRKISDAPTLIPMSPVVVAPCEYRVGRYDFLEAMKGFVPVSLRGLPLHPPGEIDFSHVGGMERVKEMLTETILWPSKVIILFHLLLLLPLLLLVVHLFHLLSCSTQSCSVSVPSDRGQECYCTEHQAQGRPSWPELWLKSLDSISSV